MQTRTILSAHQTISMNDLIAYSYCVLELVRGRCRHVVLWCSCELRSTLENLRFEPCIERWRHYELLVFAGKSVDMDLIGLFNEDLLHDIICKNLRVSLRARLSAQEAIWILYSRTFCSRNWVMVADSTWKMLVLPSNLSSFSFHLFSAD